ncbi:MAG: DMT family transporter [Pseudomonadota bacterium]
MESWYVLSIIALVLMGMQRFLYKVSAERRCPTAWTTFTFMATVTLISSIFFALSKEPLANPGMLFFIAFVNSGSFVLGTMTHIEALKNIPSSIVYPIIRLNMVIVILFSVFFLGDRVSPHQLGGIGTAIGVILILTREARDGKESSGNIKRGLVLVFISLLSGSVASISSKFAAVSVNKLGFMALSYLMGTLFSLGTIKGMGRQEERQNHKEALMIGFAMGLINFAGFYSFLKALSTGPLSIIVSITGMHFIIAVLLSILIYKEKVTTMRILGITLTILSLIFLRR